MTGAVEPGRALGAPALTGSLAVALPRRRSGRGDRAFLFLRLAGDAKNGAGRGTAREAIVTTLARTDAS